MAAKQSDPPGGGLNGAIPILGLVLGGTGLAILAASAVIFFASNFRRETAPPEPVVENPPPEPLRAPVPRVEAWWDNLPDSSLAGTVALLKKALPQEQSLCDSLGAKTDTARLNAYQKLTAKLPELIRNQQAKTLLGRFMIDCYALEPAEPNVAPLRDWFVRQIPQENAPYPPGYKSEDLDRSFWALDVSLEALTNKAIRLDRAKILSGELGAAFGFTIDPSTARMDLKTRAEKRLALRCYRNLAPTAARSVDDALAIRETLVQKVPQYLAPIFREKVDIELVIGGLPGAKGSWPALSSLVRDCLNSKDPAISLEIVALYAQADPDLAAKLEPLLADKWNVIKDGALNQAAKVKVLLRTLGVVDPTDRLTLFEKLAQETLASARFASDQGPAMLQETARLSHASTLACALLQKEMGIARFDDLIAKMPEIDQEEPAAPLAKGGKEGVEDDPKKPAGDPMPPAGKAIAVGVGPRIINDQLRPGILSKVHTVALKRGRTYTLDLVSGAFDTFLRLESSKRVRLAEDDDSGGGLNARIIFTATFDDNYRVIATSFGGRSVGPYSLTIREGAGFGGPGFPGRHFPFPPFRGKFPPPMVNPPPVVVVPNQPASPAGAASQVDPADLAEIEKNLPKLRVAGFHSIASKIKGDLAQNDLASAHAQKIAKYLLRIQTKNEIDEVLAKLAPLAKSRNLMLALADTVDQDTASQKASEAVVGAILKRPFDFSKDDSWRLKCRKLLLVQALELTGGKKSAAAQTAEIMRDLYKEQGMLLGMAAPDFLALTQPSQVMASVIKHLAAKLSKQNLAKEDKEYLDEVPRQLLAAQFVAQNDLEHTAMLQRVWIKVLSIHLEQQNPQRAKEMRHVQQELSDEDRRSATVLEQLRGGEEKLLRLWVLANDLK